MGHKNQQINVEKGVNNINGAKKGAATVFPARRTLVKKRMLDQMAHCIASCFDPGPCCCSSPSQSTNSVTNCSSPEVVPPPKTSK
ncbi:claudin-16 [Corchorus capsularis]|uniref:Claudin-16 n=1 Tax=Corchorus capsularis TaxID=210143 RepID=A0A1R3HI94_COCAP|nr:claudin-16 [Corchorus capsularis]